MKNTKGLTALIMAGFIIFGLPSVVADDDTSDLDPLECVYADTATSSKSPQDWAGLDQESFTVTVFAGVPEGEGGYRGVEAQAHCLLVIRCVIENVDPANCLPPVTEASEEGNERDEPGHPSQDVLAAQTGEGETDCSAAGNDTDGTTGESAPPEPS